MRRLAAAAPAIPYRTDAPITASTFALALLVTICVLAILAIGLVLLRRRGWLKPMSGSRMTAAQAEIHLEASRRLSIVTTAHVLSCHGRKYLVVESIRGSSAIVTPIEYAEISAGEDRP